MNIYATIFHHFVIISLSETSTDSPNPGPFSIDILPYQNDCYNMLLINTRARNPGTGTVHKVSDRDCAPWRNGYGSLQGKDTSLPAKIML